MRLLIRNGTVVDMSQGLHELADVLCVDGRIARVGAGIDVNEADEVIDAQGCFVMPGLVDIHTHLREPGREDKETIATATQAAANGGYTTICAMPNTHPVVDSATGVKFVQAVAARDGVVRVFPIAAVTKGSEGKEIVEFGDLDYHGAIAFSDDGKPVWNAEIMRRALEYTSMLRRPILNHSEIPELVGEGVMHLGRVSARLGLRGIPRCAETASIARDIELAAETGGHVHICHVSTAHGCELIAAAKQRGIHVTAEVCPHHLLLTDAAVEEHGALARVAPPLREEEDRDALRAALREGIIDCVATDHAPHTDIEKDAPFEDVPPGMIGLDFAFASLYSELVLPGHIALPTLVRRMTCDAAKVLRLPYGTLALGAAADLAIFDPNGVTEVTRENVLSKSFNTPLAGRRFRGRMRHTIVAGHVVCSDGRLAERRQAVVV